MFLQITLQHEDWIKSWGFTKARVGNCDAWLLRYSNIWFYVRTSWNCILISRLAKRLMNHPKKQNEMKMRNQAWGNTKWNGKIFLFCYFPYANFFIADNTSTSNFIQGEKNLPSFFATLHSWFSCAFRCMLLFIKSQVWNLQLIISKDLS